MALTLNLGTWVLFAGASIAAAWWDMRRLKIPNSIPLFILALYPVHALLSPAPVDPLGGICVAAAILIGGFGLFVSGLFGAADVKLLASAGLWAGRGFGAELVLFTAFFGGVLALGLLTRPGSSMLAAIRAPNTAEAFDHHFDGRVSRRPMPYGVAIALAILVIAGRHVIQP
jgi:prepilin peptidase CpaA